MSRLVDVEHADVVELGLSLRLLMDLRSVEESAQLCIRNTISKVREQPLIQGSLTLRKRESFGSIRAKHFPELLNQELPILSHEEAQSFELPRVLPGAQLGRLEADPAVALVHAAESLLPLVQINHAILAHVDSVEQVLDDGVCGRLLISELVCLEH